MKYFFGIISFLFLISCNRKTSKDIELDGVVKNNHVSETDSVLDIQYKFLNLYSPYIKFPLKISTADVGTDEDLEKFEFKGNLIPPDLHFYLRETQWFWKGVPVNYFACYKFEVDSDTEALITRTPGEYWESKIVVFIFDKRKNKILKGLEVAETFGDAGDSFIEKAVVEKLNNIYQIRITQNECHPVLTDSTETDFKEDMEISCVDSLKIYTLHRQNFSLVERKRITE